MKLGKIEICYIPPKQNPHTIYIKKQKINYSKILATCSAMLTFAITQIELYAAEKEKTDPLDRIDKAEETLLDYGQGIGRLVCIVMCVFEIIRSVKDGDANAFWGIILKYVLAYGSLHILPWAFDLIAGFFGN